MADLFGALVIAAGTVVAAFINASGIRSQGKSKAQKPRRTSKPRKRKTAQGASTRLRRRSS